MNQANENIHGDSATHLTRDVSPTQLKPTILQKSHLFLTNRLPRNVSFVGEAPAKAGNPSWWAGLAWGVGNAVNTTAGPEMGYRAPGSGPSVPSLKRKEGEMSLSYKVQNNLCGHCEEPAGHSLCKETLILHWRHGKGI